MKLKIFLILPVVMILFCTNVYCFKWKDIAIGRTTCEEVKNKILRLKPCSIFGDKKKGASLLNETIIKEIVGTKFYTMIYDAREDIIGCDVKSILYDSQTCMSFKDMMCTETKREYVQPMEFENYGTVMLQCKLFKSYLNDYSYEKSEPIVTGIIIWTNLKKLKITEGDINKVYGKPVMEKVNQEFERKQCYDLDKFTFLVVTFIKDGPEVLKMKFLYKFEDGCYSDDWEGNLK